MAPAHDQPPIDIDTGYLRRRPVEWRLRELIQKIKQDEAEEVSVAYLDIDGFTEIENTYGYRIADELLRRIDKHIAAIENADIAERYARDSFLIIYNNMNLDTAFFEADNVRRQLSEMVLPFVSDDQEQIEISPTFSAGVAIYPGDPEDHNELIALAEDAARRAYEAGGNRSTFGRAENMIPKTSHFLPTQLARLRQLKDRTERSEASLLREALSDLLRKYDQRDSRRHDTVVEQSTG